ncbi:Uncharacterized protein FKW44_015704 [Caligus rogercresseyi]|uniref:Uncharacterized protein n=1 Tax=Caligus rogercresseyi TaxID=217165 RepID=A0A7T8H0V9_CALRO|nr:Uncharacterized protein FKW44_015704 [Caligus rogercresseyi]
MGIKDMHFEGHLTVAGHQRLNKLHKVFGLGIPRETTNYCNKAVPCCSLCPFEFLGNS